MEGIHMQVFPTYRKVKPEKWARYRYNLTTGLGKNGQRFTGCDAHIALSRQVAAEGMVLLKNNGLLPLKDGTTVALFGVGSLESVYCGGGAGEVYPAYVRSIYDGFLEKAPRIRVYEPVTKFYYDYAVPLINTLGTEEILEEPDVPLSLIHQAAAHAQVAVIVIHRYSTEGKDRLAEKGDFYSTETEQKLVSDVTAAFPHSVAVLNVGGVIDVR
jgi:beta-glucosidase